MSRDFAAPDTRYKLLEAVARRDAREEEEDDDEDDIQDFAEDTMNELLAWYGYGDKQMMRNAARHSTEESQQSGTEDPDDDTHQPQHHHLQQQQKQRGRLLCPVADPLGAGPDPRARRISGCSQTGSDVQKRSTPSGVSQRQQNEKPAKDTALHSPDSSHSGNRRQDQLHLQHLQHQQQLQYHSLQQQQHRPGSVNSTTSSDADSIAESRLANAKTQSREPVHTGSQRSRGAAATTPTTSAGVSQSRVCDWCRQTPPNVSLTDSVDGLSQLGFCSEVCLNRYKMNLFCTETRQYLQQIQNSEEVGELSPSVSDSKILITPDLWLAEKKDNKRSRHADKPEVTSDDNRRHGDSERDDDACRHSDCGSNFDASNGADFPDYLSRNKRRKEERIIQHGAEISNDASLDGSRCQGRAVSAEGGRCNSEEKLSELENTRKGKRLKMSSTKDALSPVSYTNALITTKRCGAGATDGLQSVNSRDAGLQAAAIPSARTRGRSGSVKHETFLLTPQQSDPTPADLSRDLSRDLPRDLSADMSHFRRLSEGVGLNDASKSDNHLGPRQSKSTAAPQFSASPLFGSVPPVSSMFPPPAGIASLMQMFGNSLGNQFVGTGAAAPIPFLGFPSLLPVPGANPGTAGVQVPPGIPVPPPPPLPPLANPWSSLLPPNTLMIPYPVLLPIPIPIPIPFPVPLKCGQQKTGDPANASSEGGREEAARTDVKNPATLSASELPSPRLVHKNHEKTDTFQGQGQGQGHGVVCPCCRRNSISRQAHDPHSARTAFCSPCSREIESMRAGGGSASGFTSTSVAPTLQSSQNLAIDFSKTRDSKSVLAGHRRSPDEHLGTPATVTIKTEPLDLASSIENNNVTSSSSSSPQSTSLIMKTSCELSGFPSLPYLARRSLILDAPSVSKEKLHQTEKSFLDGSSKRQFAYCKRRYSNMHIKTK